MPRSRGSSSPASVATPTLPGTMKRCCYPPPERLRSDPSAPSTPHGSQLPALTASCTPAAPRRHPHAPTRFPICHAHAGVRSSTPATAASLPHHRPATRPAGLALLWLPRVVSPPPAPVVARPQDSRRSAGSACARPAPTLVGFPATRPGGFARAEFPATRPAGFAPPPPRRIPHNLGTGFCHDPDAGCSHIPAAGFQRDPLLSAAHKKKRKPNLAEKRREKEKGC